jgi:hypothetical protein
MPPRKNEGGPISKCAVLICETIKPRMNLSGHPKPANEGHLKTGQQ